MSKAKPHPAPSDSVPRGVDHESMAVLLTLADTTWRIFAPVIAMTALGIWADLSWGTKPWVTFAAVAFGFVLAILLVRDQLKKVSSVEKKPK